MRKLTPLDAQFLAIEDGRTYGHVGGIAIYDTASRPDGVLTLGAVLEHFAERLPLLPPFRERLVEVPLGIDHPYWVEDPCFDLEYHVRELALPAPGSESQLAEQVARLHARPLDRARPLWEAYVISGLDGQRAAIYTKIHHAAVDGLSGAEVLLALTDLSPGGRVAPAPSPAPPPELPGPWSMLARGLVGVASQPLHALGVLPRTLRYVGDNPTLRTVPGSRALGAMARHVPGLRHDRPGDGGVLEAPRARAPRTVLNGSISPHRRIAFASLSLSDVKRVKNHYGVTVNDVVVCVCAGALRRWLEERGELPDRPLVAMVPLSVRTPDQAGTFGNRVSVMMAPIPTDEPDPLRRLSVTHATLASAKTVHQAIPATILQDTGQFIPPALLARASRVAMSALSRAPLEPPCNVVISNVPGSPVPLYFAGATMLAHYPISAIAHSCGLNITVLSYQDRLDVGVAADRNQTPNAWRVVETLEDALAELTASLPASRTI